MTEDEFDSYTDVAQARQQRSYYERQFAFWQFRMQSGLTADPSEGPYLKRELANCDAEIERLAEGSRP